MTKVNIHTPLSELEEVSAQQLKKSLETGEKQGIFRSTEPSKEGSLMVFYNLRITGKLHLRNNFEFAAKEVQFCECVFEDSVIFKDIQLPTIQVLGCELKGKFLINVLINESGDKFINAKAEEEKQKEAIAFFTSQSTFHKDFSIYHYAFKEINLTDSVFLRGCRLYHCEAEAYVFEGVRGKNIWIQPKESSNKRLSLRLYGDCGDSIIRLEGAALNELVFGYFSTSGKCTLSNIKFTKSDKKEKPSAMILSSDLSNVLFLDVNFETAHSMVIEQSHIINLESANTKWINNIFPHDATKPPKTQNDFSCLRDSFRQLKFSMEKHGDRVESLRFQKMEMDSYEKSLSWLNREHFLDKLILLLGRYSNEHGQNWLMPILWFIVLGFCFFSFALEKGLPYEEGFLKEFLSFLNPLSNEFANPEISGIVLLFIVIWKIITAYLIYQILTAFRKYSRKL